MQVKHATSRGKVIPVKCASASLTNGKVRRIKRYTPKMVDWIAIYDSTTECCYYVSASELGEGRALLHLRVSPTGNSQAAGIRWARDYLDL